MQIAGFQKQSLIDFPGNVSAVIFTQGCNFRCGYCHNPNLVIPECFEDIYDVNDLFAYLYKYKNLLDALVITGGEPTIHADLPEFITQVKALGLKVKLDTNGTNPNMLVQLLEASLIDSIAMDIKHLLKINKYQKAVGKLISEKTFQDILQSIRVIKNANVEHEFRTTIVKGLHTLDELKELKSQFGIGYKIQNFKPADIIDAGLKFESFSDAEFNELLGQSH